MKEIYTIDIEGTNYAVGLDWEEISIAKSSNFNNEVKALSKKKGRPFGCKLNQSNRKQVGFAKSSNVKGLTVAACLISKYMKDTLYIKKLNNVDHWACYIDPEGLVSNNKEGVFNESDLLDIIDELRVLGTLTISCSESDKAEMFDEEDESDFEFKVIEFKDIVSGLKKSNDDVVSSLYSETNYIKLAGTLSLALAITAGGYYYLFTEDQLYTEIVNQELSSPLSAKESKFKKLVKANKATVLEDMSLNSGKKMLVEKVETNIYSKKEIADYMKAMYESFPVFLAEWQLDSIQFNKAENNKDIKFSAVYRRIPDSLGFYNDIHKKATALAKEKLNPKNIVAYPGDLNNDIIIIDLYFKEPKKVEDELSEEEIQSNIKKKTSENEKKIDRLKDQISEVEFRVSQELGFFDKKFGSALEDAAAEIEDAVSKATKLYDELIKVYEESSKETIKVPESYYSGSKRDFLNLIQEYSYYEWKDDKKPMTLPAPPTANKDQMQYFKPFAKVWQFTMNSSDYSTQGIDSIGNAVDILNKTAIGIYTVNYKIENETWYIKGELYEKN